MQLFPHRQFFYMHYSLITAGPLPDFLERNTSTQKRQIFDASLIAP